MKWIRIIFNYNTFLRFRKLFDRMEQKGYRLYAKGVPTSEEDKRKVRNYIKNLNRAEELYDKFLHL